MRAAQDSSGLEVAREGGDMEVVQNQNLQTYGQPQAGYPYDGQRNYAHTPSAAPETKLDESANAARWQRTPGTTRKRFCLTVGAIALGFVAIIAVVAGVLGSRLASKESSASTSTSLSSTMSTSTGTGTATTPGAGTAPAFSSITSFASTVTYSATAYPVEESPVMATLSVGGTTTLIDCPYSNNTVYKDPSTGVQFLRRCGVNAVSNDLVSMTTYSLEDCMAHCASSHAAGDGCNAVVWIWGWDGLPYAESGTNFNFCYLKNANWDGGTNLVWNWQSELAFIIS